MSLLHFDGKFVQIGHLLPNICYIKRQLKLLFCKKVSTSVTLFRQNKLKPLVRGKWVLGDSVEDSIPNGKFIPLLKEPERRLTLLAAFPSRGSLLPPCKVQHPANGRVLSLMIL